jgi:hypothetical protein
MKNKVGCSFVLLLFVLTKIHGQTPVNKKTVEHVIVYDTIVVYDTVIVYDTVKTNNRTISGPSETFFSKKDTIPNAVLEIDTATLKAKLFFFYKKDTATISLNGIILSETNKNLGTMKKAILTLMMPSLLAQTTSAQVSSLDSIKSGENKSKYALSISVLFADNTQRTGNFYGAGMKIERALGKQVLIGLSSDMGGIYQRGDRAPYTNLQGSANYADSRGFHSNIFITSSYFFGGNAFSEKSGMYFKLGIGSVYYQLWQREYYTIAGNPTQIKYQINSTNISAQLGIGAEIKLEKGGKLFIEAISMPSLFESYRVNTLEYGGPTEWPGTKYGNSTIKTNSYAQQFGIRFGYKINF